MPRRREPDTFSDELRGASESLIERSERPRRRLSSPLLPLIIVFGAVLGIAIGGAYALWTSPESVTRFFGGDGDTGESAEPEPKPEPEEEEGFTPGVDNPFATDEEGDTGIALGGGDSPDEPTPTPEPAPTPEGTPEATPEPAPEPTPEPAPEPAPAPTGGKLVLTTADVSVGSGAGGGTKSRVVGKLAEVQQCFDAAAGRGGAPTKSFSISFKLKWNGKPYGISVGAGDAKFKSCARTAVGGSYPDPRSTASKDPSIRATFRLES